MAASEWTEQGIVLQGGPEGSWDAYVTSHGFRANSIVKKDGVYYLYYTGSSGRRSDGGPAHRAIGVATSTDGVNFTKYPGNPIMTHQPSRGHSNQEEEGAFIPIVTLDDKGNFVMYYGALTATGPDAVDSAVRVATSSDGFRFTDQGKVSGGDGDEHWPVGVLFHNGKWHLWVTDHGNHVFLMTGDSPTNLRKEGTVLDCCRKVEWAWPVLHPDGTLHIFEVSGDDWSGPIKARETIIDRLKDYPPPVVEFPDSDRVDPVVLLDYDRRVWRMYYTDFSGDEKTVRLRTAPLADAAPPLLNHPPQVDAGPDQSISLSDSASVPPKGADLNPKKWTRRNANFAG